MRRRTRSRTWTVVFAAGLLLRPLLIVPMAPSGPLGGSDLLPVGLASVFVGSALLAIAVLAGSRILLAFAIATSLVGVVVAIVGVAAGLPAPWPQSLVGYDMVLAAVGIAAWRELPVADGRRSKG